MQFYNLLITAGCPRLAPVAAVFRHTPSGPGSGQAGHATPEFEGHQKGRTPLSHASPGQDFLRP
jgi:hypothetical protein